MNNNSNLGKKILYINFSMAMGGIESMIFDFSLHYRKLGHHVEVLTFKPDGVFIEKLQNHKVKVTVIEKKEGLDFSLFMKIARFLKSNRFDVLHTNNYATWLYVSLANYFLGPKVKLIHTEHSIVDANTSRRLKIEKLLSIFTHKIVPVSDSVYDALFKTAKIKKDKLSLIYNGVNTDKFYPDCNIKQELRAEYNIDNNCKIFGAIGRLVPVKDHHTLILAFRDYLKSFPNDKLFIIGNGVLFDELTKKILELNIANNVLLLGQKDNIYELLNLFDIYVMSSLSEGFSIGLMEAMSMELPVIVTNVGGNKEIVLNNVNGRYISAGDAANMTLVFNDVRKNIENTTSYGKMARKSILGTYSAARMFKEYSKLYF